MKTVRIRENIKRFLSDRPRNTAEILEHINSTMRHGTTSQQRPHRYALFVDGTVVKHDEAVIMGDGLGRPFVDDLQFSFSLLEVAVETVADAETNNSDNDGKNRGSIEAAE